MNSTASFLACLSLALLGVAAADVPKKMPVVHYSGLWNNSPFTSKPPPAEIGPENNPLDDYALIGISPIGANGHRVTLINKKTPEERITVDSDSDKSKFKILSIARKDGDIMGTVVKMSSGSMVGTVTYDDKLLALATAKPAAPGQPGQPVPAAQPVPQPGQPQPQPQPGQPQTQRQPRPRVVPSAAGVPVARPAVNARPAVPTRQAVPARPMSSSSRRPLR